MSTELLQALKAVYIDRLKEREAARRLGITRHELRRRCEQGLKLLRGL